MGLPIPPDLWDRLCQFLATHETCQVIIHQRQGHVYAVDLGVVKQRVTAHVRAQVAPAVRPHSFRIQELTEP